MRTLLPLRVFLAGLVLVGAAFGCSSKEPSLQPGVPSVPTQPPVQAPTPAKPACPALTEQDAFQRLVSLSGGIPADRAKQAAGEALAFLQEQADIAREGWPTVARNRWMSQAWLDLDITPSGDQVTLVLTHGDRYGKSATRFQLACNQQLQWELLRIGSETQWYQAEQRTIPGQAGELTPALAMALVQDVQSHFGTPAMRLSAVRSELERGRWMAVATVSGARIAAVSWPGTGPGMRIEPHGDGRLIGYWLNQQGADTGESVLYMQKNGLWKVADHTIGGEWAPVGTAEQGGPRGVSADLSLLGIEPGMSRSDVTKLIGKADQVQGRQERYLLRNLTVEYGTSDTVLRVTAGSGSTVRGLTVGDDARLSWNLYGVPSATTSQSQVWIDALRRLEVTQAPDSEGIDRITSIQLGRAP